MSRAVICILTNQDSKVLFVKRSIHKKFLPGLWALPAGMVREGEKPAQAVKREFMEEFGIKVNEPKFLEKIIEEEKGRGRLEKYIYLVKPESSLKNICFDLVEADGAIFLTFEEFYSRFKDKEIGNILRYLREKYQGFGLR